jgi:hypothetical protein
MVNGSFRLQFYRSLTTNIHITLPIAAASAAADVIFNAPCGLRSASVSFLVAHVGILGRETAPPTPAPPPHPPPPPPPPRPPIFVNQVSADRGLGAVRWILTGRPIVRDSVRTAQFTDCSYTATIEITLIGETSSSPVHLACTDCTSFSGDL